VKLQLEDSAGIQASQLTVEQTSTASGYDYKFTYTASVTELQGFTGSIDVSSSWLQDALQDNVDGCAESIVENVEFDQYIDCVSFLFFYTGLCDDVYRELDVVFVLDSSNSFNSDEYNDLKQFVLLSLQYLFPDGTRTAALQFATVTKTEWQMHTYQELPAGLPDTITAVNSMSQLGGLTYTDNAIEASCSLFPDYPSTGRNPDQLLMLVTDGEPTSGHDPCVHAGLLVNKTVLVFGISEDFDSASVMCLTDNNADHIFYAQDTTYLQTTLQEIANITCPTGSTGPYDGTCNVRNFLKGCLQVGGILCIKYVICVVICKTHN
jgi:hypothetical protein